MSKNLTDDEYILLQHLLAKKECSDGYVDKFVVYLIIAIVAALLFLIFSLPSVDNMFSLIIPDFYARLIFKTFLVFIIIYLIDRIIYDYRKNKNICV